ncbi:MAG: hypothetical protein WC787_05110 [Patescibacteria group bacterium]|jgi:hypothetical protein
MMLLCAFFVLASLAVGAPFVYSFFKRNIVGRYVWVYRDDRSLLHVHADPLGFPIGYRDNDRCVVRLRIGGWFRTNDISRAIPQLFTQQSRWQIRGWDGTRFILRDSSGGFIGVVGLYCLMRTVESCRTVPDLVDQFRRVEKSQRDDQASGGRDAEREDEKRVLAQRDLLGIEIRRFQEMAQNARTGGEARLFVNIFRQRMAKLIKRIPEPVVKQWTEKAKKDENDSDPPFTADPLN